MGRRMLRKVRRIIPEQSENFNNEIEYIFDVPKEKYQRETIELKNTVNV